MLNDRVKVNAIVIQSFMKLPEPRINLAHHRAIGTEVGVLHVVELLEKLWRQREKVLEMVDDEEMARN